MEASVAADGLRHPGRRRAAWPPGFDRTLPEGIYRVTVDFGGDDIDSVTSCKGEARRLYAIDVRVPKGATARRTFLVDTHRPEFPGYTTALVEFIEAIRSRDGRPVLVTSVARRRFDDAGQVVESLGDYPDAVRRVALEHRVPELATQLASDVEPFDPSRPDPPAAFAIPASPLEPLSLPDGR